jgi:RNA polymerase sigma factor (sigma-70 family)
VSIDGSRSLGELGDEELLGAVRAGDRDAYGVLYARHAPSAKRYARALLANDPDADDAVGEVFARLLQAIEGGRGPEHTFPAYLFASVRHECIRIERRRAREALDRAAAQPAEPRSAAGDHASGVAEAAVVRAAFASLPGDMRDILRLTEVDQLPQREIATRLAEDPGTVATRAMRARRALGSAYLRQHVGIGGHRRQPDRGCQDIQAHIASFLRGTAGSRRRTRIEEHLATCDACRAECADLRQINGHLRSVAVAVLAAVRTAGEAAWSQLSAVAAASAAPIAATGVVTAAALAPLVIAPPPPTVPAPPVVEDVTPRRPVSTSEPHLPFGWASSTTTLVVQDTATPIPLTAIVGGIGRPPTATSVPASRGLVEDVTVLPPVPTTVAPAVDDTAVPPAPESDPAGSPPTDPGPSTDAPVNAAPVTADATTVPSVRPAPLVAVTPPEPTPSVTATPPTEPTATDPPALVPTASDDGGAATTVPHNEGKGKGKGQSQDDEGGDPGAATGDADSQPVVTFGPRGGNEGKRPVDAT